MLCRRHASVAVARYKVTRQQLSSGCGVIVSQVTQLAPTAGHLGNSDSLGPTGSLQMARRARVLAAIHS